MFAKVIIDIKAKEVDRPFTYRIPDGLISRVTPGVLVSVPFGKGNTERSGFVIGLTDKAEYDEAKIKEIISVLPKSRKIGDELISLAIWMRHRFGGTLYQCLSVVLPEKTEIKTRKERYILSEATDDRLSYELEIATCKKHYAKMRLLSALLEDKRLPYGIVTERLRIPPKTVRALSDAGLLRVESMENAPVDERIRLASYETREEKLAIQLNWEQQNAVRSIENSDLRTHLLYGVTGSGKTEVYLKLIEDVLEKGQEAIVLIPEISLTYQTVMRFYQRFGDLVSVVHSKITKGEKCERFELAKNGSIKVMIGPRSALFTPFQHLGMIIIDEFHDGSYESDQVPKYNAIETAKKRAEIEECKVVLGSATPLVTEYGRALAGETGLHELKFRAVSGSVLPEVTVIDMRDELKNKNRSVFSRLLREKIEDRLAKKEQVMLFLNRRGYSGAVSCRTCGEAVVCPHCSVSLNYHRNGTLQCHICGYTAPMVKACPKCRSTLVGTFGIGTEKVEQMVRETFPSARVLRMDADTTDKKNGHEEIIDAFSHGEADILIGTQMIVKGHDFKNVTLVGILAADLSLLVSDYRSAENTFALLLQAEGRAGRHEKPGECVVQTYNPEHYAVEAAKNQDFEAFYEAEKRYRKLMKYPPYGYLMGVRVFGPDENTVITAINRLSEALKGAFPAVRILGPTEDNPYKVKDQFRQILTLKTDTLEMLLSVKTECERIFTEQIRTRGVFMTFES